MNPFPETADIETSSDDYATRFAGAVGKWFLACQAAVVLRWIKSFPGATVLDVGGGHGQLAIPLMEAGYPVTVVGSDVSCRKRIDGEVTAGRMEFEVGNMMDLPYPNGHFDVVLSIRLLPHCERWPQLVAELCRVARHAVIVDYPSARSLNVFSDKLFGVKKKVEKNTRPYRLFSHREVDDSFVEAGWHLKRRYPEFFWPMVLHRLMKSPRVSRAMEAPARLLGLTHLWGSPILAQYKKAGS